MTILSMNRKELEKKVGRVTPELENLITDMGTPSEEVSEAEVSVEVFPNRPDLLSFGNFARAVNQFGGKGKVASFKVNAPLDNFTVTIDKSVKGVRPYTVCAIVKGLKFDDAKIKEVVDIQEKLHGSLGRKRRKLAIGIYPLNKIALPIRFVGRKPEEIKFLPLLDTEYQTGQAGRVEMTGRQILRGHPAGREYGDLLKDFDVFPVFVDADDEILSMPPIINSEKTGRIDEKTRDIFIECSGHNLVYLKKCLNIIVASLSEMGGKIYGMNVKDARDGNFVSPDMSAEEMEFKIEDIEKTLGVKLDGKKIKNLLFRMGVGCRVSGVGKMIAEIPAYRCDILHWIDLAEEVAIAYGYENFEAEIPDISTIGSEDAGDKLKRTIGNILAGLGLLEVSNYHLTTKKNVKRMHYDFNGFIEVEDSKTERDVLRMDLMTGLLQVASENSDAAYPQKIFEMGRVFEKSSEVIGNRQEVIGSETGVSEVERLGILLVDERVNFTEMKQVLDYLFKMLDVKYSIEAVDDSNYIIGRCGRLMVNGVEIGRVGEIAPRVLKNWKIRVPCVGAELALSF
ncbi:MAG: phenylalanine--tRNA ligase subunit beta [Nanoarchaeota archaeon]|nr:phenylalanine--tRNA ligase subunit beta [Nanoarchaeota archaeon]